MAEQNNRIDHDRIKERMGGPGGKLVMGIDGFIDEVWQIIASRDSMSEYLLYEKMTDFSGAFAKCSEGGYSNEIVRKRRSYGGFTANTGKAVTRLGVRPVMLGRFGANAIDPVFAGFAESNELVSVGDPGNVQIYEFTDGKLMLVHLQEVMGFDWKCLTDAVPEAGLKAIFADADIIAIGYWSLMPAFDEIVAQVCGLVRGCGKQQRMFFDFADIRKRDRASLDSTLGHLAELNRQIPMTLSLNENEAEILFSYHGEPFSLEDPSGADIQAERMRGAIGIDELIVHTPYFAAAASESGGSCVMRQHYCTSPVITTGAGDNFNGGYLAAALNGLDMHERLAVANAVTHQYVRLGYSPDMEEMLAELAEACRESDL
ncbi:MAG: carbohydrate kinase family protein [Clostridiales bacterium]|nr:carbohydrate kinase family protein [Clostridiales bacterium]